MREHPEQRSRWPLFLVTWIHPLIQTAHKRQLQEDDVWPCPSDQCVEHDVGEFWTSWETEVAFAATQLGQPYLVGELVLYVSTGSGGLSYGVALAIGLGLLSLFSSLSLASSLFQTRRLGVAVRSAVMMAVYEHALKLTASSRAKQTTGTVTSLVAIDSEKLFQAALFGHFVWHGPVASVIVMCLLIREVGWAASLCCFCWIMVLIPLQTRFAGEIGKVRQRMIKATDERVKLTSEMLSAIRAIKVYAWEVPLGSRVLAAREKEIRHLGDYLNANTHLRELLFMAGPIMALVLFTFIVYYSSLPLTVPQVFKVLSFVNILRFPLNLLAQALKSFTDASVSIERIERFFSLPVLSTRGPKRLSAAASAADAPADAAAEPKAATAKPSQPATADWSAAREGFPSSISIPVPSCYTWAEQIADNVGGNGGGGECFALRDIAIELPPDCRLVGIVGPVGSGKSTFLSSVLQETTVLSGVAPVVRGDVAYCAQTAWILNQTVKENILFGAAEASLSEAEARCYCEALDAAVLVPDLAILPQGDKTEIGERGINLSGGQKQRVSLARAIWAAKTGRAQILVLDDPFSAVDATSTQRIFDAGVLRLARPWLGSGGGGTDTKASVSAGEKGSPPLFLVSLNSHLHLLNSFDRVLVFSAGRIAFNGKLDAAAWASHRAVLEAAGLVEAAEGGPESSADVAAVMAVGSPPAASGPQPHDDHGSGGGGGGSDNTAPADAPAEPSPTPLQPQLQPQSSAQQLIKAEERGIGAVSWTTYLSYFAASFSGSHVLADMYQKPTPSVGAHTPATMARGGIVALGLFLLFSAAQVSRIAIDYSLAQWAANRGKPDSDWAKSYYVSFSLCAVLCVVRGGYLNFFAARSADKIHRLIFARIVQAPVNTFFDRRTVGEILNKMSKDTETLDSSVPEFMLQVLINWLYVGSIFGLCIWATPLLLVLLAPTLWAFFRLFRYFTSVSRDLKRLESVSRSPIYSSLSETLSGLDTIRAYGATARFLSAHLGRMNRNQKFFWHLWMSTSWMTVRLEVCTSIVLFAVALLCVCLRETSSDISLGLALSYGLQLTALFQRCLQVSIDVATYMISVERIFQYNAIEPERNTILQKQQQQGDQGGQGLEVAVAVPTSDTDAGADCCAEAVAVAQGKGKGMGNYSPLDQLPPPPPFPSPLQLALPAPATALPASAAWPTRGAISFRGVRLRYRDNTPVVLDGLSFDIAGGEMVGICGRTGAGKSSILVCLFRIVELCEGAVFIDGVNIQHVPLRRLRDSIAIIPQDPVLLSGSVRFQLDPWGLYTDAQIFDALDLVGMREWVAAQRLGLLEPVLEGGENLSHGQRQLVCIARALLRCARVLVIDEGTSSVDPHTDALVQNALRVVVKRSQCTVVAIAHRTQTIMDYHRILCMSQGRCAALDSPKALLADPASLFSVLVKANQ